MEWIKFHVVGCAKSSISTPYSKVKYQKKDSAKDQIVVYMLLLELKIVIVTEKAHELPLYVESLFALLFPL